MGTRSFAFISVIFFFEKKKQQKQDFIIMLNALFPIPRCISMLFYIQFQ